jgi:hypothetical protein
MMKNKHLIFSLTFMSLIMNAPPVPAGRLAFPDPPSERNASIRVAEFKHPPLVLAENDQKKDEDQSQPADSQKDRAPAAGADAKENGGRNSDAAATKPLKPFVPSEKIAADQAVDFPVDI